MTFQSNAYEIEKRKNGILAIENLKKTDQVSDIELYFEQLNKVLDGFQKHKQELIQDLKDELERDPQKRLQALQQGNQIVLKQISLEEAIEQNQPLKQNLDQLEKQFKRKFNLVKEKLMKIVNE